jgi:acyl carrier protein
MNNIREQIHEHVTSLAQQLGHYDKVEDDESLVISGLLDSLAVMRLVVFMEQTFGINFADEYFDQDAFDTIDKMVEMVNELAPQGSS